MQEPDNGPAGQPRDIVKRAGNMRSLADEEALPEAKRTKVDKRG